MNITTEQRKEALNQIISSKYFEEAVDLIAENKLTYYEWLKKNINIKKSPVFKNENSYFRYALDYIYKCMLMDKEHEISIVYFIRNEYNGLLKIGKTNNLQRRIKEIEKCFNFLGLDVNKLTVEAISYCPHGMNNGKVETYYHNIFKQKRKFGEWFDISYEELIDNINVDHVINNVLVTVEDVYDFPTGVKKLKIAEEDIDTLKENISEELKYNISRQLGFFDILYGFKTDNSISSKELFEYIMKLDERSDTNLDNKIKKEIEYILSFLIKKD